MEAKRFAIIGAAGFVARRHMDAIRSVGGELVAVLDPHDSVGILDSYFPNCRLFTVSERFDRFLNRPDARIDYVVVCSPNWLHDAHCRWALRAGAHAICEKPLVLNPWNVDQLHELEQETGHNIYPILQLRCHPDILAIREAVSRGHVPNLEVVYTTRRGRWYLQSWKGDDGRSGGILMNLGIHLFDAMCFVYGVDPTVEHAQLDPRSGRGVVRFGNKSASWRLSIDENDLPGKVLADGGCADRFIRDADTGDLLADFSHGFTSLHTEVYQRIMEGTWPTALEAKPGIELVTKVRNYARGNNGDPSNR